ncbi:uncharacterized protein LOC128173500 [Crassostrea angulata]|uniref:uncharacterized protein LOC128173500 n=1 Tax=Magallana angulata TaxID=2784310 RepID=UPI0022B15EF8|nr:uncharacterized protein LOC128173500 [Crassostrea angulata]
MGLLLFRVCLVINAFNIATENPVTTKPYRFPVYPVNECPRSEDEFKTATQRRNCTKGFRYMCAPNKYLSSLIEFCTDQPKSLYQKGNCVILEGTGDLDHYSCVEKFNSSCPLEFYNDEEIYKYPACLEIDRELRCFAADNGCKKREFHTTESHGWLAIGYIIATAAVLAVIILSWIIFQKRKREQVQECTDNNENESLLEDNPEIDDNKLRQFLSKGEITVCHVRCIIVGCGKAGKTTLLKRLQNVSFDELMQIERTEMVDFHVNSFEVLLEEETIQSVEKEDTLPTILFSKEKLEMPLKENDGKMAKETHQPGIRKKNVSQKSSLKNTTLKNQAIKDNAEDEEKLIFEPHSQDTTIVQNQFSPEPNEKHGEDIDANVDKIDFEKFAILKIKDAVNELLNEKDLCPRITFLDFAGQSMYYAFHQIFLRPKSCSILVVDMTKSLYDKVSDQDENEKEYSQFASWSYKDYFKFWLKSIDSFSDTESPVIIVGTHADKLSKEECRKFLNSLNELFDNWSHSGLRRHLNEDRMYTIGFPDSGSELEDLKDLKKCIANIVKCPRYSKENIRPVWALFEHILNKMKETEKVIPRKTLSDYSDQLSAQEFRIDESEISKMLVFFHRVGVLLYFDKDGLREKIILDIQWLIDAFKCIIEYPVRTEENDMKRRHFCRTGELDSVELDRIWHIQGKDFLKHKTTIIAYMQQLGLLMRLKELHFIDSTVYYFPSMNSKRFDKTGENNAKSSILCFKFDDEMQLQINVFHGIVLKCSKLNNWSILTEGAKNNICLYQNAACFSFQKHVVVLCNCNFEIRVQVWASPNIYDGRLLKKIKHSVEDIIHDDDLSYEIGYKCRKDVLNIEEDVSFISHSIFPVSNHLCEICDIDKKHVVDNDICWELEVNDENQGK